MNILYLTNHLNIGGITSYLLSLTEGMKKRGHNVYIASSGGELLLRFTGAGVTYLPLPIKTKSEISYKVLVSKFKLIKYIKEKNIDIIHANTRVTQVLGFLVQRSCGVPYVSTCHGFFKKRLFRRAFPCWGKKTIAISEAVKEHLIRDFKVREQDIRVIHNGIDIEKFQIPDSKSQTDAKKKLGLGEGPVIGIIARLSEEKGHTYLIKAMRGVVNNFGQAQLLIAGEGRTKKDLETLVRGEGLGKNVFFLPSVMDTREVLSCLDVFVLPSLKEGLGLSLMEAMASGLAVIGSDVGGIKSLIQHGHNGLKVQPASSAGLSSAISQLLRDPDKAKSLGENARMFISRNFAADKMVLETERVYLECLSAKV